jgi:putative ABC transport system permease protein
MMTILYNLVNRKLRTVLTILGITIGIIALTVMGAMSEKLDNLINGAIDYYNSRIIVQPRTGIPGGILGPPLTMDMLESINNLPGIDAVFPSTFILYQEDDDEALSFSLGFPPVIKGIDARRLYYKGDPYSINLDSGRLFGEQEKSVALIGMDIARNKQLDIGDSLKLREHEHQVVGIMSQTLTLRDNFIFIPIKAAQEILAELLPYPLNLDPYTLVSEIEVYPVKLADAADVAENINRQIKGVRAFPPGKIKKLYEQKLKIFIAIAISSAVVAVLVGGLSILNTMMMSVSERTKEIGLKKAIGASNSDILKEFIVEAGIIGTIGGIAGLAFGWLTIDLMNRTVFSRGIFVFDITPRLVVLVFIFAVALGILAGLFPAWTASKRKPIDALRAD